jgi:hypothetical protein
MIPFELLATVGGAVLGGVMQIMAARADAINQMFQRNLKIQEVNEAAANAADKRGGKSASVVKRAIALTLLVAIVSPVWAPMVGMFLDHAVSVVTGYTEFRPGFLFFPDKEVMVWKEIISGDPKSTVKVVITPAMSMGFWTVLGFYFGHSVAKR